MANKKKNARSVWFWITNAFGVIMLVLLASKMVLALLFVIAVFLLVGNFRSDLSGKKLATIIFFTAIFAGSIFFFPEVRHRFSGAFNVSFSGIGEGKFAYNYHFTGLSLRLVVWTLSIKHLFNDGLLFLGVGTGDATDYLNSVYAQYGLLDVGYTGLNAHNEYVQTLVTLGLVGFLYLSFLYVWGLRKAIQEGNTLLLIFMLIISLSSWSESLLTVNKGVVFFSFWYPLLLLRQKDK